MENENPNNKKKHSEFNYSQDSKNRRKRSKQDRVMDEISSNDEMDSDTDPDFEFLDDTAHVDIMVNPQEDDYDNYDSSDNEFNDEFKDSNNSATAIQDGMETDMNVRFTTPKSYYSEDEGEASDRSDLSIQFKNDRVVKKTGTSRKRRRSNSCDSQATTIPDLSLSERVPDKARADNVKKDLAKKMAGFFLENSDTFQRAMEFIQMENSKNENTLSSKLKTKE